MNHSTGFYPRIRVDAAGEAVVFQADGVVLTSMVKACGLAAGLPREVEPWRAPCARHDPGRILTDLALSLATGGDYVSDLDRLRNQPEVYGAVASNPSISRWFKLLTTAKPAAALATINTARAAARAHVWDGAGEHSPPHGANAQDPLIIDLDASLGTSHSVKEKAGPTWKKGYGFHPLMSFVDHGPIGTGEPLAVLMRAGNAGPNTVADHIQVVKDSLKQLPVRYRPGAEDHDPYRLGRGHSWVPGLAHRHLP